MLQRRMIFDGATGTDDLTISVDLDAQSLGTIKSGAGLQQHLQPTGILDAVFRHDPVPERATVVA